jgi:hypothetical protein
MNLNPSISAVYAALIGAGVAAIVGGIFAIFNTWIARRSEERIKLRELVIKTAMAHWKEETAMAKYKGETFKINMEIPALDAYIIHGLKIAELLDDRNITAANVEERLRNIREISSAATKAGKKEKA